MTESKDQFICSADIELKFVTAAEQQLIYDYRISSEHARRQIERIALAQRNLSTADSDPSCAIDRIEVAAQAYESHVSIVYLGAAADLLACGAIEPGMELRGRNGKSRCDSHGDYFRRTVQKDGRIKVFRQITNMQRVRELPKISPDFQAHKYIAWLDMHPGQVLTAPTTWSACDTEHYGTQAALISAGCVTAEAFENTDWSKCTRTEWGIGGDYVIKKIMDGYFSIYLCNRQPAKPNVAALVASKQTGLRLAWTNPAM